MNFYTFIKSVICNDFQFFILHFLSTLTNKIMKCTHTHAHTHTYILCFWCQHVVAYVWTCIFLMFSSLICLFYSQYKSTASILHYLKPFFCFVFCFFTVNLVTVHLINKNVKILFQHCEKKGVVLLFIIKVNSYVRQFATSAGSSFLRQRKGFFRPCHTTIFTVILPTRPW